MNVFKYILERLLKKRDTVQTLKLQEKSESDMHIEDKKDFLEELKLQVIPKKKEIEITERVGDGLGFKKNIGC